MTQRKLSVSVSQPLVTFVETYRETHAIKTKSEVIEHALKLLRDQELERAYAEASAEIDPAWDVTLKDGLEDETWT